MPGSLALASGVREARPASPGGRAAAGGGQGRGQQQRDRPGDRRIAQPRLRTALVGHVHVDGVTARGAGDGNVRRDGAVVHLHRPEVLVVLDRPLREAGFAKRDAGPLRGAEPELVPVEVVAVGDVPARLDGIGTGRGRTQHEGDVRVQELVLAGCADLDPLAELQQPGQRGRSLREPSRRGRRGLPCRLGDRRRRPVAAHVVRQPGTGGPERDQRRQHDAPCEPGRLDAPRSIRCMRRAASPVSDHVHAKSPSIPCRRSWPRPAASRTRRMQRPPPLAGERPDQHASSDSARA